MSELTTTHALTGEDLVAPSHQAELAAIEQFGPHRFANRELSRLDFGARLLDLAEDPSLPLLERVKFMAIFSELLDEFFQVRVAGLEDQVVGGITSRSADGLRPREQLVAIRQRTTELVRRQDRIFLEHLQVELAAAGVLLLPYEQLSPADREALRAYFLAEIYPILTPLAVDPGHPFPMISNLSLNLAVQVRDPASGEERVARVKVPPVLPRFLPIGEGRFVPVDQVIAAHLDALFPGMVLGEPETFRVTRNADLTLEEEEAEDLLIALEMELRRRRFGRAVRLEAQHRLSPALRELLLRELDLSEDAAYTADAPIGLSGLWSIYNLDRADLHAETWTPITPPVLLAGDNEIADVFAVLRERDVLLHHPYDSFSDSVEEFVAQAADDPDVLGIKHTLYRTSGDSPIVASLIRAAESGKQVAALVELKARFDEAANIGWAKALEDVGVHVVYGIMGYKTHSKTALVLRREADGGVRRYCHIGTGNYNSRTARIYEDVGLLTADEAITRDVARLFNFLTGFSRHGSYERLLVSPVSMRPRIIELISEEREAGPEGRIDIKVNGLTDPRVIDELYAASRAGVPIRLCVRGLCCLRPGVPELSENISVCSIVGEFLEHSRIFSFGRPEGPNGLRVLIGSSDLMERNLDRRIEVTTPVDDPALVRQLVDVLERNFADDRFSWVLGAEQRWRRRETVAGRSVQAELKALAVEQLRHWREQET